MKILYFTDTHIRGSSPKNRKDIFIDSLENKFLELIEIVERENIDYVIHGGDLFDRPDVSISVASRFANILSKFKVPIYTISGNHDIFGHNPKTLNRSILGLFNSIDLVRVIEDEVIYLEKSGLRVQLTGQAYTYDLDHKKNKDKYMIKEKADADYAIHVVHGMLLDKPFIDGIPYTLIDDIKDTKADLTLSGHYHLGFKTVEHEGKYFINPGSLVRLSNSLVEMKRRPKITIISLTDKIDLKDVYLKSVLDAKLVLDREALEIGQFREEQIVEFKQSMESSINFNKLDINDILIELASVDNIDIEVKNEALRRIGLAQIKKAGAKNEIY